MIDQSTVQRILDAAEIVDVVGEFVTLKRRGTTMIGLCPFHNEKTPSFNVSPAKGIYKCFGCGKGGSSVNFVMEHEHLSYTEALKWLAKKYHIEVREKEESPEDIRERNDRESQMIVSEFARQFFQQQLWESDQGRLIGLSYFRERGFRDDIIKKFGLGFCPDGKDIFTVAAQKEGYKMEFLEKTGLTIKRDDWVRDRFAGRVMFPITSISGRVIAFGGRTLSQDKTIAKYLNSPESEIYHKSRVLYGIYEAKRAIIQEDSCYLVEGYTDVISMHQAGIENVVASSGTSLTTDQIRLIRRFTNNVTILYDGDQAGIKASLRGIDMVLEQGINVKVLLLPDGEDPDSFSRSMGASELKAYIKQRETDFIKFKTNLLLAGTENDPLARARLIGDIVGSISVIPDEIVQTEYLKECSRLLDVREEVLYSELRKLKLKSDEEKLKREEREAGQQQLQDLEQPKLQPQVVLPEKNPCAVEEREILRILFKYGKMRMAEIADENSGSVVAIIVDEYVLGELSADPMRSTDPIVAAIFDEYGQQFRNEGFDAVRHFVYHPNPQISKMVSDILSEKYSSSPFWKARGSHVEEEQDLLYYLVPKILQEYKLRYVKYLSNQILEKMKNIPGDNLEEFFALQGQFQKLKSVEGILSERLGKRTINH